MPAAASNQATGERQRHCPTRNPTRRIWEQICRRRESEIQIDASLQVGHGLSIQRPCAIGQSRNSEIQRGRIYPTSDYAFPRSPLRVAGNFIGEASRPHLRDGKPLRPRVAIRHRSE